MIHSGYHDHFDAMQATGPQRAEWDTFAARIHRATARAVAEWSKAFRAFGDFTSRLEHRYNNPVLADMSGPGSDPYDRLKEPQHG